MLTSTKVNKLNEKIINDNLTVLWDRDDNIFILIYEGCPIGKTNTFEEMEKFLLSEGLINENFIHTI